MSIIGIIVADYGEYKPLIDKLSGSEKVDFFGRECHIFKEGCKTIYAVHCGIGKVNAASAAMYLYCKGCDTILNFGYSGGISGVQKGDIVVGDSFMEHDFDLVCLGYKPCQKPEQEYIYKADAYLREKFIQIYPAAKTGLFVTGDCFVSDDDLRNTLKEDFGAISCDMETAAIASVCHQTGMKFACVREISDDAGNDASVSYRQEAYSGNIAPAQGILTLIEKI